MFEVSSVTLAEKMQRRRGSCSAADPRTDFPKTQEERHVVSVAVGDPKQEHGKSPIKDADQEASNERQRQGTGGSGKRRLRISG